MSFTNPGAFFLFLLLIPFLFLVLYNYRKKQSLIKNFVSDEAFRKLGFRSGKEIPFFKAACIILSLIFLIFTLTGPQWGEKHEKLETRSTELIFLLDTSYSMNAQDLKPSRLELAKHLIVNVTGELEIDYVSLINFAGTAYVQCPMTIDYDAFKLLVQVTEISPPEEQGTNLDAAFEFALRAFKQSQKDHKLIILLTDGEDHSDKTDNLLESLKKKNVVIFTVGVGSVEGAPIPVMDKDGNTKGWKKDRSGNIVKSKLNATILNKIASETKGQFFRLADLREVDYFVSELKKYSNNVLRKRTKLTKIKRFHYPLILAILFLLVDMMISERRIKWKK
jgi:Ca-activated chloride channel family protein